MASDEVLFKVALDLSKADSQFKDHSELWKKHNEDIKKGEKAMQDYADNTVKDYAKINNAVKSQIGQVTAEGKAIQDLDKKFQNLSKNNKDTFDSKQLKDFDALIKTLAKDMAGIENLNLSVNDIDKLTSKLSSSKDEFETLNVLVDFFETKMKQASVGVVGSLDAIKEKIQETQLNIKSTESFIKESDAKIKVTAPGQDQANLIAEREAAKKALNEEKIALEDYKLQLKSVATENITLTTELRRVKDELVKLELEGGRGSARWVELKEKAEEYNVALKNTNAELNRASSSTAGLDNLIGAVNGVVGAFAAAEGAQALFGSQNEDFQKTLVKLNGALALLNGLQAIQTELAKKGTLSNKALTFIQGQYAVATNASATATARLAAASKLLGIGLIVGALAAIVVYWKDIAKYIGLTSDKTEDLNALNKASNEIFSEQAATLTVLVKRVKEGGLSFNEKQKAVEDFNKKFGDTLGTVKDYTELERKLIEQGDDYIKYLGLKAKAEAAYQLAIEKSKLALLARSETEAGVFDFVKAIFGSKTPNEYAAERNEEAAKEYDRSSDDFLSIATDFTKQFEELGNELDIVIDKKTKKISDDSKKAISVLEELIKKQKSLKSELIDNDRERDKTQLTDQVESDKKAYAKQIDELKISEEAKRKLRAKFNEIYNTESGTAYEKLRKDIKEIDEKYDAELEKANYDVLSAIASVYNTSEALERKAIEDKWIKIRKELKKQIDNTNDELKKQEFQVTYNYSFTAEEKDLENSDTKNNLSKIDREKEIADAVLKIYQTNNKALIKNEKLKQLQLLVLEQNYLDEVLKTYQDGFKKLDDKQLFDELTNILKTSVDPAELEAAGQKLAEAFGNETAKEILKTVGALKEVKKGIDDIDSGSFKSLIDDIGKWTSSLESFSKKLADTLGLQGKDAEDFANSIATAISSTFESLNTIFQAEIDQHKEKLDAIQESINGIEDELEREKKLYEDGYANNYGARQKDLEDLKNQKKQEEDELRKAQKNKAALAKAELIADSVSQLGNLITASSNIFKWASKIPFIGVPLAVGLIGTMFGAFALAKTKAFQAIGSGQKFRRGLTEGALSLDGPTHEESGFGLYNSKTGERVAEFEHGEDVLVVNRSQKKKYQHVLDALIADAQGRGNLDSTLEGYYAPKTGEQTMQVVRSVNLVTVKAEHAKEEASKKNDNMVKELKKLNENFEKEFEGFKKEQSEKTESWETPEYFHVKKGNTTKKYPKKK